VRVSEGRHNRQRQPVQKRRFQTGLSPLAGETLADRQLSPPVQPDGEAEPGDQKDPPHSSPDVPQSTLGSPACKRTFQSPTAP
jgi:hypothetical protein